MNKDTNFKCEECECSPEELHARYTERGELEWLCEECFIGED